MGLRELKEAANQQFVRGKFAQCAQTYHQILRLAPRDPNMRVRHAEACRRAGDRLQAVASYRAAADLLLELGCESRARGALKAALELDPRDPILQADVARLSTHQEEVFSAGPFGSEELPLLPSPEPLPPPAPRPFVATRTQELLRTPALPPIHRALPSAPSVPSLGPPVLLPAPRVPSATPGTPPAPSASRPGKTGAATASAASTLASSLARSAPPGAQAPGSQPKLPLPPRAATTGVQAQPARAVTPPVLQSRPQSPRGEPAPVLPAPPPVAPVSEESSKPRLEVRRLSASALAFRCSPKDNWAVIRSHTPLEIHLVENLDQLPPMLRDFTVESKTQSEPNAMH